MGDRICLVVDDEPAIRGYVGAILQRIGIQSLEAENAVEALRILQKLGGQIGLLITDIEMPGDMDGIDLAYSVQSSFSTLPVILISGYGGKAPGGFTYVQKPFIPDAILKAIDKTMDRSRVAFPSPCVLPNFSGNEVGYGDRHGPRWAEAQPGRASHQHLRRCPPLRPRGQEGTRRGIAQADTGDGV